MTSPDLPAERQPDRLAEIRQRRAAISTPPWEVTTTTDDQWFVHSPKLNAEVVVHDGDYTVDFAGTERTSQFIAHAPDDIDHLLERVQTLETLVRAHNRLEQAMYDTEVERAWPKDADELQRAYERTYNVDLGE